MHLLPGCSLVSELISLPLLQHKPTACSWAIANVENKSSPFPLAASLSVWTPSAFAPGMDPNTECKWRGTFCKADEPSQTPAWSGTELLHVPQEQSQSTLRWPGPWTSLKILLGIYGEGTVVFWGETTSIRKQSLQRNLRKSPKFCQIWDLPVFS